MEWPRAVEYICWVKQAAKVIVHFSHLDIFLPRRKLWFNLTRNRIQKWNMNACVFRAEHVHWVHVERTFAFSRFPDPCFLHHRHLDHRLPSLLKDDTLSRVITQRKTQTDLFCGGKCNSALMNARGPKMLNLTQRTEAEREEFSLTTRLWDTQNQQAGPQLRMSRKQLHTYGGSHTHKDIKHHWEADASRSHFPALYFPF